MNEDPVPMITYNCPFCLTSNQVDLAEAESRPRCTDCARPLLLDRPIKISAEDFDQTVLGATAPVLVDFYADWCGPCKILAPLLDELAHKHVGKVLVAKLDTDAAPEVAARYDIRGIPTVILFAEGKEVGRSAGIEPEKLQAMLAKVM